MSFLDTLAFYFAYPFVRYALIVGVLIALCSSLLGVTLVVNALARALVWRVERRAAR